MQTRINMAKKIARAVGTVIKNATWSSISWKQRKMKRKLKTNVLKGQTTDCTQRSQKVMAEY